MIPSVRIGNDIKIDFEVFRNTVPENFQDATNIAVVLVEKYSETVIVPDFKIEGNKVAILVKAEKQKKRGEYSLILSYKRPNSEREPIMQPFIVDAPAFQLVEKSLLADKGTSTENLTVETITINGVIGIDQSGATGLSAYQLWELQEGNEGKSIEDFFNYLQEPARSFVEAVEITYQDGKLNINY